MSNLEHQIQRQCVRWFKDLQYRQYAPLLINIANGARRTVWEQRQAKEEGLTAGAPDLLLLLARKGYHSLAIEMKWERTEYKNGAAHTTRSYQSPAQKVWQKAYEAEGGKYCVCRTFEEFRQIINDYIND